MLQFLIPTDTLIDANIISSWNSVIDIIRNKHILKTTKVDGSLGWKYRGDLYGLFLELDLPREYIYPHMLVNGYANSSLYDGKKLDFLVIDSNILRTYHKMFTRKKKR